MQMKDHESTILGYLICNDLVVNAKGKTHLLNINQYQSRHQFVQVNNIRSTYIALQDLFNKIIT